MAGNSSGGPRVVAEIVALPEGGGYAIRSSLDSPQHLAAVLCELLGAIVTGDLVDRPGRVRAPAPRPALHVVGESNGDGDAPSSSGD